MAAVDKKEFPITMEAVSDIKNMKAKWKRKYDLSEKAEQIQEIFTEVGCRNCFEEVSEDTCHFLFSCKA